MNLNGQKCHLCFIYANFSYSHRLLNGYDCFVFYYFDNVHNSTTPISKQKYKKTHRETKTKTKKKQRSESSHCLQFYYKTFTSIFFHCFFSFLVFLSFLCLVFSLKKRKCNGFNWGICLKRSTGSFYRFENNKIT